MCSCWHVVCWVALLCCCFAVFVSLCCVLCCVWFDVVCFLLWLVLMWFGVDVLRVVVCLCLLVCVMFALIGCVV